MSIAGIQWAYGVEGLSAPARAVLVALGWMANERDECWPSQSTLAEMTSLTDRTVRTALAALEADGLITRTSRRRRGGEGGRTSDLYTVCRDRDQPEKSVDQPEGDSGGYRKEFPVTPGRSFRVKNIGKDKVKEEHSPSPSALGHTLAELTETDGPLTAGEEALIENMHTHGAALPKIRSTLRKQRTRP